MKLRIEGATLRLRLSDGDVARFAETGQIESAMPVAPGVALWIVLREGETDALEVTLADHVLTVTAPAGWAEDCAAGLTVGVRREHDAGDGRTLAVVVEKDLG